MSQDCLFCKIIKGEIPCTKVYEDENVIAFLDIFPISKGHTVVVPKKHFLNLLDFPADLIKPYFEIIQKLSGKIKESLKADGFNVMQNNFAAAGQVINHCHFHIIPRWENDGKISVVQQKEKTTPEELSQVQKIIAE